MKKTNCLIVTCLSIALLANVGQASLVGHWKLDEGIGATTACEVDSPTNDGTILGGASFTTSDLAPVPGGNSSAYVGTGAGGEGVETGLAGIAGANARTITAWIKTEPDALNTAIVSWGSSYGGSSTFGHRFSMKINNINTPGQLRVEIGGGFVYGTTSINDGQWHHVACTLAQDETANANVKLYVDGALETTTGGGSSPINSDAVPVCIGCTGVGTQMQYKGVIDEVRIYDEELSQADIQAIMVNNDIATVDSPAHRSNNVMINSELTWIEPSNYTPEKYDVYFDTDPNFDTATVETITGTSYDPFGAGDMSFSTTYYWRADSYKAGVTEPYKGVRWCFTTSAEEASFNLDSGPHSETVAAGEDFAFTAAGINAATFAWYEQSDPDNSILDGVGPDIAPLNFEDVSIDDEGVYYCVIANENDDEVTSQTARLMVQRPVVHWKFENNLDAQVTDDGSVWPGQVVDPNESDAFVPTAVYETGIDGTALKFAEEYYVEIPNSADYYNFYPQGLTVSCWVNTNGISGYHTPVSKHGTTPESLGWVMNCIGDNAGFTLRGATDVAISTSNLSLSDGQWHFIAIQYDNETGLMKIYIDGLLAETNIANTNVIPESDNPVRIGANNEGDNLFLGLVDELRIWNYPVSAKKIGQLYANGSGVSFCTGEVEYDFTGPEDEPDCVVDLYDFAQFTAHWLDSNIITPEN